MPQKTKLGIEKDKISASCWARDLLKGEFGDWVILDTETTGLDYPEIIEISVISKHGSTMLNSQVKPVTEIEPDATAIHGITNEMLQNCPTFSEIYPRLEKVLKDKLVVIYNSEFDTDAIFYTIKKNRLPRINFDSTCAMKWYAKFCGDWSSYWGNYRWQKLPGGDHTARGDCKAVYGILQEMADYRSGKVDDSISIPKDKMFPPVQLFCKWESPGNLEINFVKNIYKQKRLAYFPVWLPHFYWKKDKD